VTPPLQRLPASVCHCQQPHNLPLVLDDCGGRSILQVSSSISVSNYKATDLCASLRPLQYLTQSTIPTAAHSLVQVVEVLSPPAGVFVPFADPGSSTTMTSAPPNGSTSGGKSLNISSSHSPLQQQHQAQITSPSFDSRRSGHQSSPVQINARNNQGSRKQHKNSRRPRFADEDEMAESVSHPGLA
jgi:hypothetical protein